MVSRVVSADRRLSGPERGGSLRRIVPFLAAALLVPLLVVVADADGPRPAGAAVVPPGDTMSWGANSNGELGDGTTTQRLTPTATLMQDAVAIDAGLHHAVALKADGTVWTWGNNLYGQQATGTVGSGADEPTPHQVPDLAGVVAIAAGGDFSLAVDGNGDVWRWGSITKNNDGTDSFTAPRQLAGITGVTSVAAGSHHALALTDDGTLWAWGQNPNGELGDGTTASSVSTPVRTGLTGVVAIAAGSDHSLAVTGDGRLWAWGANDRGQLGNGSTTGSPTPQDITPRDCSSMRACIDVLVSDVAAGIGHSVATSLTGAVYAWGRNDVGQVGDGTTTDRLAPIRTTLTGVTSVAAGGFFSLAVTADGTIQSWGSNSSGQLGDGTTTGRSAPAPVPGIAASAVAGGGFSSLAITAPPTQQTGAGSIVFTSTADGGDRDIFVMAEDGSGRTQLTANDVDDSFPDWSPDASKIVFESNRADPGAAATVPVPAATAGPIGNPDTDGTDEFVEVLEIDLELNEFVGCDVVTPTPTDDVDDKAECLRYTYDANDDFSVQGLATTLESFEQMIAVFDDVHGVYATDPAAASSFDLIDEQAPDDLDIHVMNPDGSGAVNLTADHEGYDGVAAWSPDGSTIAFVSDRGGAGRHVWLMDTDGSSKRQLTTTALGGGSFGRPSWSPDGTRLVIHRGDLELYELFVTDLPATDALEEPGQENQLTNDGLGNRDAAWSPDGHRIAYMRDGPAGSGGPHVYVLDVDTGASTKLTPSSAPEALPTFSPDGRSVAYSSAPFGDEEIYVSAVGGGFTKPLALTSSPGSDARPAWADNLSLVALSPTVEASPAVVPVEHIALQDSPDIEAAPLELGKISLSPLELGKISLSPLELGKISLSPLELGKISLSPLELGKISLSPLELGKISLSPGSSVEAALAIPLSTIPPTSVWEEILAGEYAGSDAFQGPLSSITLLQVLQNPTTLARFQQRSIAEFDFSRTPLTHLSIYGLLLDGVTLADIDWPTVTCAFFAEQGHGTCGETLWGSGSADDGLDAGLTTVELAGLNTALLRIYAVPMGDITMAADTPLLTRGLAHLRLASGRIGFVRHGDLTATAQDAVIDCTKVLCHPDLTLAEAEAAAAIKGDATIGHLGPAIDHLTLGEVVTLFAPPDMRHLGEFPLDDLRISGYHGPDSGFRTQTLQLTYTAVGRADVVDPLIELELPEGSPYRPGSATMSIAQLDPGSSTPTSSITVIEPTTIGDVVTFQPDVSLAAGEVLTLRLDVFPGTDLGPRAVPSARVRALGLDQVAEHRGTFRVTPNGHFADRDPATATEIAPDQLNVVHIAGEDDHEVLALPAPAPGSVIQVFVDHLTFDVDAALYGTAAPEPVRPYGATPRVTPLPDEGAALFQAGAAVAPDAQQDFPFLFDLPVTAVGNQRGTTSEHLQAVVPAGSDVDRYVLQLSGYLGDHGPDAFTVRYRVIPPPGFDPAPPRGFADASSSTVCGDLPTTLPTGTKSLVIVPCERMVDAFGASAVEPLMTKLAQYAAHPKVEGVVLPVDRATTVRDAYADWDLEPHDPERANDVVREILTVVDGVVGTRRGQIDYVTLVGDDEVLPFARTLDLTTLGNEAGFAADAQIDGQTNALVGSFAHRYLLTDDAYGDWEPEQWGGWPFYLADTAVGRIAAVPSDGVVALDNFLTHDGELDPQTSYTTGYEFMSDFAQEVDVALRALVGSGTADIGDTWSRTDALAGIGGAGVSSVNAHADPSGLLPANGLPLLTAADIDQNLDLTGKLLFSMGCHGGLNRPDISLALPPSAEEELDLPQVAHRRGAAGYAGNTGYGLGLTEGIGLSERVYLDFADKLGSMATGRSLTFSKHEFLANEPLDNAWAAKALQQATLYGLPQYTVAGITPVATPTSTRLVATDPVTGLPAELVEFANTFDRESTDDGDYYAVDGETTRVVGRAVQPLATEDVRPEGTDALITDLSTSTVPDGDAFDPLVVQSALSSSGALPVTESPDMISNSEFASVRTYQTPDGPRARLSLVAGQFAGRDVVDGEVRGTQNLIDSATVAVLNNGAADGHRPVITASDGVVVPTGVNSNIASFTIEAYDPDGAGGRRPVQGGLVLAQDSAGTWHRAVMQASANDPYTLTGGIPGIAGTDPELRFFVQVWDGQLVGRTTLKGLFDRTVVAQPTSGGEVTVTVAGAPTGGFYPSDTTVTVDPPAGVEWRVDGGEWTPYTEPVAITGDGVHRFDHRTATGSGTVHVPIDATPPQVVKLAPDGIVYALGQTVPTTQVAGCRDAASGIAQCTVSGPGIDTASVGRDKTATFTVTAVDGVGHQTEAIVTLTYSVAYLFDGFYTPVRNEPIVNEVKAGRTVPLKFRLFDADGNEITTATSATVSTSTLADCTSGSEDPNQITETTTDSKNTLRYDPETGQYVFNWKTGRLWSGCRKMILRLDGDGRTHTALFSFTL